MARPWYPWYAGDYARRTSHLTFVQDAAYRRMLDHYYTTGSLPAIAEILLRVCCAFADDEKTAVLKIASEFFRQVDGRLVQDRVEEELIKSQYLSGIRRESGKRGAAKTNGKFSANSPAKGSASKAANVPAIADTTTTTGKQSKPNPAPAKPARFDPLAIALPDCIHPDVWRRWIDYRRERKLATPEQTARAQIKNLEDWYAKGHRSEKVIADSIANGWQGLFEPKTNGSATSGRASRIDNYAAQAAAARGDSAQPPTERIIQGEVVHGN